MPKKRDVLAALKRDELVDALDAHGLEVADRRVRDGLVDALARSRSVRLDDWLVGLSRDRLKELCRQLGLDDSGRAKVEINRWPCRVMRYPGADRVFTAEMH